MAAAWWSDISNWNLLFGGVHLSTGAGFIPMPVRDIVKKSQMRLPEGRGNYSPLITCVYARVYTKEQSTDRDRCTEDEGWEGGEGGGDVGRYHFPLLMLRLFDDMRLFGTLWLRLLSVLASRCGHLCYQIKVKPIVLALADSFISCHSLPRSIWSLSLTLIFEVPTANVCALFQSCPCPLDHCIYKRAFQALLAAPSHLLFGIKQALHV